MTTALLYIGSAGTGATADGVSGTYNATPPTLADGGTSTLQLNSEGDLKVAEQFAPAAEDNTLGVIAVVSKPLASATYAPSVSANFGAATKLNVKGTPGNVFAVSVKNGNAAERFFQLHNKATVPLATEVPIISIPMPGASVLELGTDFFTTAGVNFAAGVGWAISTTLGTFTDGGTASDHAVTVVYK